MITKRFSICIAVILLSIFTFISIASAFRESLTFDEIVHIEEGKNALLKHEFKIDTNNPPFIRELAVIPLVFNVQRFISSPLPNMQAFPARLVIIFLGLSLGVAVYVVASKIFGADAGLITLFLYVFDPNILAYSHYVTQDLGAALFFFLGFMSLLWFLKSPSWTACIVHGVSMGLMAASKITTLPYYIVTSFIVVFFVQRSRQLAWLKIVVAVSIFLMTIWATYFFQSNVIVAPGDAQGRVSSTIRTIAVRERNTWLLAGLNFLERQPVPLGDYIAVIKNTIVRGIFSPKPAWYSMITNIFFKTPIPLLIVGLLSVKKRKSLIVFLIPIVSVVAVSTLSGMQPLVRYVLPLYPFVFVIAGSSVTVMHNNVQKVVLLFFLLWYVMSSLSFYPHFISYANELAGPKEKLYEKFTDSNMDWGQSLLDLKHYIDTDKPSKLFFSYFGRDNAALYGFSSDFPFGSYKFNEICAFHEVNYPSNTGPSITAISVSNWYGCGYYLDPRFGKNNIHAFVGDSILVFNE